jgi:hypothetical protein
MNYTIEKLIEMALQDAEAKKEKGLLFKSDTDLRLEDWSKGDPETLYSITAMYAQFATTPTSVEEAEDLIETALEEAYPDYL